MTPLHRHTRRGFAAVKNRFWTACLFIIFAAGIFTAGSLFAQETETAAEAFSPFVSDLTIEIRNNMVRLNWVDSAEARGPVYLFRSPQPFTGADLADLRPVLINYGVQTYVDETEGAGSRYYFAAASDTEGQRYDIFIPYSNTVMATFASAEETAPPAEDPAADLPAETVRTPDAIISGITALAEGGGIIISFTAGGSSKSAVLYRNTQPISRIQDLLSGVIVQSGISSPFIDYPAPGTSYYYAVLFEDDISKGVVEVQPGRNATVNAVAIAERGETTGGMRPMPLPALSVYNTAPETDRYSELPGPAELRADTAQSLETAMQPPAVPAALKRPRVFARDLDVPAGGEDSILRTIVQGPFLKREWQETSEQLQQFLSLPRSALTEARAHFYLGQTYYFLGKNREALIEFLTVQNRYPNEANEWLEAVLAAITY